MSEIERLEYDLLQLLGSDGWSLKPTVEKAAQVGEKLEKAKAVLPYGQFQGWVKRLGIKYRTAADYMMVYRHAGEVRDSATLTIGQLLQFIRSAKLNERQAERNRVRKEVAEQRGLLPDRIKLVHGDCRKFRWPECDVVASDPPWASMPCYQWLAKMAGDRMRDGGLALVQCGVPSLPEVVGYFEAAGMSYRHCLAIIYQNVRQTRPVGGFVPVWKPVLVFVKGRRKVTRTMADGFTVTGTSDTSLHEWQQSLPAWKFWLSRFTNPDELVVDTFSGSGTSAVAAFELGLRWLGTEIDKDHYEVARGRLAGLVP